MNKNKIFINCLIFLFLLFCMLFLFRLNNSNSTGCSPLNDIEVNNKLKMIHENLKIKYGTFDEELPEQKMVVKYLTGKEKVLEIGSNIGRNSLIIGYILGKKNQSKFVTLECNTEIVKQITENMLLNNMNFHIENSALSKKKLIQKGWDTIESDTVLDGYTEVKTITLDDLHKKYKIRFDTLILDCESCFYNILKDMPDILKNIKLVIMENDYHDIHKKEYVDNILKKHNFYVDYTEAGGWGVCSKNFFEVWKKK